MVEIAVARFRNSWRNRGICDAGWLSVPSLELLAGAAGRSAGRRSSAMRRSRSPIEAAVRFGWDAVIGQDGEFVGMHGFGASAPAQGSFQAFRHYR